MCMTYIKVRLLAQIGATAAIVAAVRAVPLLGATFMPLLLHHVNANTSTQASDVGSQGTFPLACRRGVP